MAELKQELNIRGLTVSGTKNDLIERLKNFHEQNGGSDPPNNTGGPSVPAASNTSMSQPPQPQQLTVQPSASNTILHQSGHTGMVVATLPLVATVGGGGAPPAVKPQLMQFGSCSPSSPLSPTHSEHSLAGTSPDDHTCNGDAFGEMVRSVLHFFIHSDEKAFSISEEKQGDLRHSIKNPQQHSCKIHPPILDLLIKRSVIY